MQVITIGLDIAKNVFQVHGVDAIRRAKNLSCLGRLSVIHDRCIQYPSQSMSVVTPIATLLFGAAK